MDENEKNKEIEEIKQKIDIFYDAVAKDKSDWVANITYMPTVTFSAENAMCAYQENDVYVLERYQDLDKKKDSVNVIEDGPVTRFEKQSNIKTLEDETKEPENKTIKELYILLGSDYFKIGTIDENGNIQFTEEYLQYIKNLNPIAYDVVSKQNGKPLDIVEQELQINREADQENGIEKDGENKLKSRRAVSLSAEELEKRHEEREKEAEQGQKNNANVNGNRPLSDENARQVIAEKTGISVNELSACVSIKPETMISDVDTFADVTNTEGKYVNCFVTYASSQSKGTSRFAFWGITPDGNVEQIPGLEEREGVNTGKEVYAMNHDGSEVKIKQTNALFLSEGSETGFSLTIGQYGEIETEYIRKDPTQNRYLATQIETSNQYAWTSREVLEQNNDAKTSKDELQETLDKAEHQLGTTNSAIDNKEGVVDKTNLQSIDTDPNTNEVINMDTIIRLHDGTETTLYKEAENLDLSVDEYIDAYERTEGDCPAAKVEQIRIEERERRAEREIETPEEAAWRRLREKQERDAITKAMKQ